MKGRYAGSHMTIYGHLLPGAERIVRSSQRADYLTERAKHKLKIIDWHNSHGKNISLTGRHFSLTRKTLRSWIKQLKEYGPIGLNEKSREPKRKRKPATSSEIVWQVIKIRKQYPAWSKYKIQTILERDHGLATSASNIGRILKRRGLIDKRKSTKRRKAALCPKLRFPRGLKISEAGDMIQIDTKYIMLVGGRKLFQFTAIDVLSKRRVLRVYPSLSSRNGRLFLEECIKTFPFKVKAIQTDNGREFLKEFDKRCKELNIPHYCTYPRSPKQNSYVERSHGSDEEEFYRLGNIYQNLEMMNSKIQEWQNVWNEKRPHQALNYRTPNEYLEYFKTNKLPTKDYITLQT
jgi:transposase InsO family protein